MNITPKIKICGFNLIFPLVIFSCGAENKPFQIPQKKTTAKKISVEVKTPRNFNPQKAGYTFMNKMDIVKFIYDPETYHTKLSPKDKIYLVGTFNNWQNAAGKKEWEMKKDGGKFFLEIPYKKIDKPGNSGYPEFKFLRNKKIWQEPAYVDSKYTIGRNLFVNKDIFRKQEELAGCLLSKDLKKITFVFQPDVYNYKIDADEDVFVVGTFNNWANSIGNPKWKMEKTPAGVYTLEKDVSEIDVPGASGYPEFKFVAGERNWQEIDKIPEKFKRNNNLWVNFDIHGDVTPPAPYSAELKRNTEIIIYFSEPLDKKSAENAANYVLSEGSIKSASLLRGGKSVKLIISPIDIEKKNYVVDNSISISGIADKSGVKMKRVSKLSLKISRKLLKKFFDSIPATDLELGAAVEKNKIVFRLFGPRLKGADVLIYKSATDTEPYKKLKMSRGENYIWEADAAKKTIPHGTFYKFLIHKSEGDFLVNDPYAKACVSSSGKSIVIYPGIAEAPFAGWTDENYSTPAKNEIIIYETHIANITGTNPACSNVPHTYIAMTIDKPGSPLDYLKKLGVNAVEFLPLHEYQNSSELDFKKHYSWGYMTSLYFAPESSFSTDPAGRKQVSELKKMVDTLHKNGIAVIVDVVYNHTSNADNALGMIDSEYYFTGGNLSGCGNDTYCSRPMMRKLILDSLSYWLSEYHIDGFRFDLSHLTDQKNLFTKENIKKLEKVKVTSGNLILIAEDWSNNRAELKNTTVARWNDTFRNDIKDFVGKGDKSRDVLNRVRWSKDKNFYAGPMETVNYVESHDEETVANKIKDFGWKKNQDVENRAKMAGLILFTSQGIPMILEGQELMRDREAQLQDYDSNMFRWDLVKKNAGFLKFYKKLIKLRAKNPVLRPAKDQPNSFYKQVKTKNRRATGYVLNADGSVKKEPKIMVLLNPSKTAAEFILPAGTWKIAADTSGFNEKISANISGKIKLKSGQFALAYGTR